MANVPFRQSDEIYAYRKQSNDNKPKEIVNDFAPKRLRWKKKDEKPTICRKNERKEVSATCAALAHSFTRVRDQTSVHMIRHNWGFTRAVVNTYECTHIHTKKGGWKYLKASQRQLINKAKATISPKLNEPTFGAKQNY